MNIKEVMNELEALGSDQTRKVLMKHGARQPIFGVKISDLKKILKKTGKDHNLGLKLYRTGNSDAMYLAGLMITPAKMTEVILEEWLKEAYWSLLTETTVANAAAESPYGLKLARQWIREESEKKAACGWSTYCGLIALGHPDLKLIELEKLLNLIEKNLNGASNRVKYCMNASLIAIGSYYPDLSEKSLETAAKIGKVTVDMGETACKVPDAAGYIKKMYDKGKAGVHLKTVIC